MASATAPMHALPTRTSTASGAAPARTETLSAYVAPAVAGAVGAAVAVATTWWIVATQTLQMSF